MNKRADADDLSPAPEGVPDEGVAPPEEELVGPPAPLSSPTDEEFVGPPAPGSTTVEDEIIPPAPVATMDVGPALPEGPPPDLAPSEPTVPPPTAVTNTAPLAQVAHVPMLSGPEVEERLRRLEKTLTDIKEIEQRLAARAAGEPVPNAPPVKSDASSLLSGAASLLEVGKMLLPTALTGPGKPPTPGSLADLLADLRASYRMLVDPRYSMTWLGRIGIPVLFAAFLFPWFWMPLGSTITAWLPSPIGGLYLCLGQLITGFGLFRIATSEARRYRETAPDLPPSLRL